MEAANDIGSKPDCNLRGLAEQLDEHIREAVDLAFERAAELIDRKAKDLADFGLASFPVRADLRRGRQLLGDLLEEYSKAIRALSFDANFYRRRILIERFNAFRRMQIAMTRPSVRGGDTLYIWLADQIVNCSDELMTLDYEDKFCTQQNHKGENHT